MQIRVKKLVYKINVCFLSDSTDTFSSLDSNDMAWLDYSLLETSEERQQLLEEQEEELRQSIENDRRKEEAKNVVLREKERENGRLEAIRSSRDARVPPEPEEETSRIRVAVQHVFEGKLVRYFASGDRMLSVYDWIGSLAKQPEHFQLNAWPEEFVLPSNPVRSCTLFMQITEPVFLLEDPDVTFKGYEQKDDPLKDTEQYVERNSIICFFSLHFFIYIGILL